MKPENHDEKEIRQALQAAFPAVDTGLRRDLWPDLLRRIETPPALVPWYDWILASCLAICVFFLPKFALLFAYHL
jgi:hypothetical protein